MPNPTQFLRCFSYLSPLLLCLNTGCIGEVSSTSLGREDAAIQDGVSEDTRDSGHRDVEMPDSLSDIVVDDDLGTTPLQCTSPKIACGDECVDTLSDPRHCGGCTQACASSGEFCNAGTCFGAAQGSGHRWTSCVVSTQNQVYCWGYSTIWGLNGVNGAHPDQTTPVLIPQTGPVASVHRGREFTCALKTDGSAMCWGNNANGMLGIGVDSVNQGSNTPLPVENLTNAVQLEAGMGFVCALLGDQTVKCWGSNRLGQLGIGQNVGAVHHRTSVSTPVRGLDSAQEVVAGEHFACALKSDTTVWCWGKLSGITSDNPEPVVNSTRAQQIPNLTGVVQLASNHNGVCALKNDDTIWCWGVNPTFEDGENYSDYYYQGLTQITGLSDIRRIYGGSSAYGYCVVHTDHTVSCWGYTHHYTVPPPDSDPVEIGDVQNVESIILLSATTCFILRDGDIQCWGQNHHGQIGNGQIGGADGDPETFVHDPADVHWP